MAKGHPNIRASHPTTLMITKDEVVGLRGDCVVAVGATKGAAEVSDELKRAIRSGAALSVTIEADGEAEEIHAFGHPSLTLRHPSDLVVRKSEFLCERTLAIKADKAAADLRRDLIARLRSRGAKVQILIRAGTAGGERCSKT